MSQLLDTWYSLSWQKSRTAGASGQAAGHIVSAVGKQGGKGGGDRDREKGRESEERGRETVTEAVRDRDRDRETKTSRQTHREKQREGKCWCSAFSLLFIHPRTGGKHAGVKLSFWKHLPDILTAMLPW